MVMKPDAGRRGAVLRVTTGMMIAKLTIVGCAAAAQVPAAAPPLSPASSSPPPPAPPATFGMEIDPDSPLAPLPDIGVDWPDLASAPGIATTARTDVAASFRYGWRIDGVDAIGG